MTVEPKPADQLRHIHVALLHELPHLLLDRRRLDAKLTCNQHRYTKKDECVSNNGPALYTVLRASVLRTFAFASAGVLRYTTYLESQGVI